MMARWNELWFREQSPINLWWLRTIICIHTLWLLLSRTDLPSVLALPPELWSSVSDVSRLRYGIFGLPISVEYVLYWILVAAVVFVLLGRFTAAASLVAGLLLYHFAPLETILYTDLGPYFNGFTLPILAFLILSFTKPPFRSAEPSASFRWPVILIQTLFAFNYFASACAKLHRSGSSWLTPGNIQEGLITTMSYQEIVRPIGNWIAQEGSSFSIFIAMGALILDVSFILVPFSRRVARVLVPIAFLGHVGIAFTYGIIFLSTPLLLIYVDWSLVETYARRKLHRRGENHSYDTT